MRAELDEETIDRMLLKLRDVMKILDEFQGDEPDGLTVSPIGRAVNLVEDIIEILGERIVE